MTLYIEVVLISPSTTLLLSNFSNAQQTEGQSTMSSEFTSHERNFIHKTAQIHSSRSRSQWPVRWRTRPKSVYRTYPPSSREEDLEANTLQALASIPLSMMRKFTTRSCRFMDAYDHGLNGRQAAWAAHKYKGHRILPQNIVLEELELEKQGVA
jgi:hypothetical protein